MDHGRRGQSWGIGRGSVFPVFRAAKAKDDISGDQMLRLHAVTASVTKEGFHGGFAKPTSIDLWVRYLGGIKPRLSPDNLLSETLRRNIGHRMQLLEFECGLLLLNLETQQTFSNSSTLHETISRMKMQQVSVIAHSILEGIGCHLVRVSGKSRGDPASEENRIDGDTWRAALHDEVMASATVPARTGADLKRRLVDLTNWRDRLHLIDPHDPIHLEEFSYASCFIPAHQSFRFILNVLNPKWPPETCLNDDLSSFI